MRHLIFLLCFMLTKQAVATDPACLNSEDPVKSVWRISNSNGSGTAFAINKHHLVTNFHIIAKGDVGGFVLTQPQNPDSREIAINRFVDLSAIYDLAILETEEILTDCLEMGPENSLNNIISISGYHQGSFWSKRQTRVKEHFGNNILPPKSVIIDIGYGYGEIPLSQSLISRMAGSSGGPVLNFKNQVVGVLNSASLALGSGYMIRSQILIELIEGNVGLDCFDFHSTKECVIRAIDHTRQSADEESVEAQYGLALVYWFGLGVERDLEEAFKWLEKASEQGHVLAQFWLVILYLYVIGTEQNLK